MKTLSFFAGFRNVIKQFPMVWVVSVMNLFFAGILLPNIDNRITKDIVSARSSAWQLSGNASILDYNDSWYLPIPDQKKTHHNKNSEGLNEISTPFEEEPVIQDTIMIFDDVEPVENRNGLNQDVMVAFNIKSGMPATGTFSVEMHN